MQSSMAVAGMDALSDPLENILTRRANQWHYSIIAQFAKRPWPCPTTGSSSAIAGKKSLPTIEVASARRSCERRERLEAWAVSTHKSNIVSTSEASPQTDEACGFCGSDRRFMTSSGKTMCPDASWARAPFRFYRNGKGSSRSDTRVGKFRNLLRRRAPFRE